MINEKNEFKPQPSTRIASRIAPDYDTWTEYLAVVDILNPRTNAYQLEIRSFFESSATGMKAWDEPPSGAINIEWASAESKKMAQIQLRDLRVLNVDKNKKNGNGDSTSSSTNKTKSKSKSWMRKLSSFGRKPTMRVPEQDGSTKISYGKGSETAEFILEAKQSSPHENTLQRALRESLATQQTHACASENDRVVMTGTETSATFASLQEENDIAVAKALSLSEVDILSTPVGVPNHTVDEYAFLNHEVPADPSFPPQQFFFEEDSLDRKFPADKNFTSQTDGVKEDYMDRKMPANPLPR